MSSLGLADYERTFSASHPRHPLLVPHNNTELTTWFFDDTNKDFAYEYYKVFLQMLNRVDEPQSHWLLKAPIHTFFLDTLLRYYPSASIIMTHRRLEEVLPSWARLCSVSMSLYLSSSKADVDSDRYADVKRDFYVLDVMIQRLIKFRYAHKHNEILDILYDDFEQAMLKWLRENPQGKQGRNIYTLEEFGLTSDEIEKRYEEYNNMFLKHRKPSDTHIDTNQNENSTTGWYKSFATFSKTFYSC